MANQKKPIYDPSFGLDTSRRNGTLQIKLNSNREMPESSGKYNPWGKGAGNPIRDEIGNVPRKTSTLNKNKVTAAPLVQTVLFLFNSKVLIFLKKKDFC